MQKLTFDQAVSLHRELWEEIANRMKADYENGREDCIQNLLTYGLDIKEEIYCKICRKYDLYDLSLSNDHCFLCSYDWDKRKENPDAQYIYQKTCPFCPLDLKCLEDCKCIPRYKDLLYGQWFHALTLYSKWQLAKKIAEAPVVNELGKQFELAENSSLITETI